MSYRTSKEAAGRSLNYYKNNDLKIKNMKKNYLLILISLMVSLVTMAGTEVSQNFKEKFATNKNTLFDISNRMGDINIVNCDNDEISISVEVKVEASNEEKAQGILNNIEIVLKKNGDKITAETLISRSRWKNVVVDIDYEISMPSYVNTHLICKYGDVSIENIEGTFNGGVKYGNFVANILRPSDKTYTNTLKMSYCDQVIVKAFDKMKMELAYSDAKIGVGNVLSVDGRYSDLEIGDVAVVELNLAYSDLELTNALELSVDGRFSDIEAGTVSGKIDIETQFGDVEIDRVTKDFDFINVQGQFGDIEINIEKDANYQMQLEVTFADMSFPKMFVTESNNEGSRQKIKGYIGSESASRKVKIKSSYGDIDISNF